MLIALMGGFAGLVLGYDGVRALLYFSPAGLPRVGAGAAAISLDLRVFVFALAITALSGLLFGLIPAVRGSRADVMLLMKDSEPQSGMSFRRGGERAILMIAEVAMALAFLAGAGLLMRTFIATRIAERGFDEDHVLTLQMALDGKGFERADQVAGLVHRVQQEMKQIHGVHVIAITSSLPFESAMSIPFTVSGRDQSNVGRYHGTAAWRSVSPGYFDAFQIRLLGGRLFSTGDELLSGSVAIINRAMMRRFWPEIDANPLGEFIVIGDGTSPDWHDPPRQIVGVVADIRDAGLEREPMMYVPVAQLPDEITERNNRFLPMTWVVRTIDDGLPQGEIAHALSAASGLPMDQVRTMHEVVAISSARTRFYVLLSIVFAVLALFLAAFGLYGLMTYSVQQRRREIGVRIALGAQPENIRNMVLWQGLRLTLIGIGIGVPLAMALTRFMEGMIFGVRPWDPAVIAGVSVLLLSIALTATYFPSVRATHVSPRESLKSGGGRP